MSTEYESVPEEMNDSLIAGAFWFGYAHSTSTLARDGVEKTGKILSRSLSLAHDIVPFTGELQSTSNAPSYHSTLFKDYTVSLCKFPMCHSDHSWKKYTHLQAWDPERSKAVVENLSRELKNGNLRDHEEVDLRGYISLERLRQEKYDVMTDSERELIKNPKSEVYVFKDQLKRMLSPHFLGRVVHAGHPFVNSGAVDLREDLVAMFTSQDVDDTQRWINDVVGSKREIPVASLDALSTWEETFPHLPSCVSCVSEVNFYDKLLNGSDKRDFRTKVILESLEYHHNGHNS